MEAMNRAKYGRVLVAEDDPALRNVIRFNLQQAGFEVIAARNGAEAWDQLQKQSADMVVTDMQMPLMSGLELLKKLRADPRYAQLPAMMLTAKGYELDFEQLRAELGIVEVMKKPFSPKQLARAVAQHVCQPADTEA